MNEPTRETLIDFHAGEAERLALNPAPDVRYHAKMHARTAARLRADEEVMRAYVAWIDAEEAGPDYGTQTRDTHPDGEAIWRRWWDEQLRLCARFQALARATLIERPTCPYCGTTEGLRQTSPPEAPDGPDYICAACWTGSDEGPTFDDLPAA